jgi:hypothetical protein
MKGKTMNDTQAEIKQLFTEASPEAQKLFNEVFELEKGKLHMSKPHGIVEQILSTVKEVVR